MKLVSLATVTDAERKGLRLLKELSGLIYQLMQLANCVYQDVLVTVEPSSKLLFYGAIDFLY